jgi:hypothetical protein
VDLIEAIHQGNKAAIQRLVANPDALNSTDLHGNTPLHYAVAQRDLALIERLVKQGAPITAGNLQGETAADWFHEYIVSFYCSEHLTNLEELLHQQIKEDDVQFLASGLKAGLSRALRFSRGETLLHWSVELQKPAIVKSILEGISNEDIKRLLHLANSRGLTPLSLAQQRCQPGTRMDQEILNYLRERQHTAASGMAASAIQIQPTSWFRLSFFTIEAQEIKALADSVTHPLTSAKFEQLNSLRLTIVKLAYKTAFKAFVHWSQLRFSILPLGEQPSVIKELLQQLFGGWSDQIQLNFEKKLRSSLDYLARLIQQQRVDQVIQFFDEKSPCSGCYCPDENKIFLNPAIEPNSMALVITLIHEVTHQVEQSYDFFRPVHSIKKQGFSMDLDSAYQLAATGKAEALTSEQRKRFEIQQLLEEGFSDAWQQNLYRWMALNSAETLAIAILALATVPVGAAEVISTSQRKSILKIHPWFLSGEAVSAPLSPPKPNPTAALCQPTPSKALRSPSQAMALPKGLKPVSPESDVSTCSRSSGERSPGCQLPHLPTLTNAMAALAQSGDSTLQATQPPQPVSSLPLISQQSAQPQ